LKKIHWTGIVPAGIVLLTLVAYGLRVVGAGSSIAYIPDTQIIRQAFDLGQRITDFAHYDIGLAGAKYPLGLSWFLLGIYGVIFVGGLATGRISSLGDFENLLFTNRTEMHLIAVISLGVITAAIVPVLFVISRRLNPAHRGWLAAGMGAFNLLLVHFSHQARPHAALAVFALASVALLVAVACGAGRKWAVAATICSAMTIGTLQNGIVILLPFFLAWFFYVRDAKRRLSALCEGALNAGLLLVLVIPLYPDVFRDYGGILIRIISGQGSAATLGAGAHFLDAGMFSLANIPAFLGTVFNYQPLLLVAVPAALVYFLWSFRNRLRVLAVGMAFPLVQLVVWATFVNSYARIILILTPFFIVLVSYGLEDMLCKIGDPRRNRRFYALTCAVVLLPMLVTALRFVLVTAQTDTRTQASRWVEENLPENSVILVNFQALELTPTKASIEFQQRDFPGTLGTYDQWLLKQDYASDPSLSPAFDLINGYLLTEPQPALLEERGVEYLLISTYRARISEESDPWAKYAQENGTLVRAFCPARNVDPLFLPEDIQTLAAWHLWEIDRPGPIVLLFRLGEKPTQQSVYCT
jgi:hypothetical protein